MTESIPNPADTPPAPRFRRLRRLIGLLGWIFLWFTAAVMTLWATLAVYYGNLSEAPPRTIRAAMLFIALAASLLFIRPRKYGRLAFVLLFTGTLIWFRSLRASNDRDWLPDVDRVPKIVVNGDTITVHNVRNFEYRSENDFTPRWEDRTYRLSDLHSVDFLLSYWGSPSIAHGMVSFAFGNGEYLAVSIETRKQKSEGYSTIQGFFRQYELIYIFADERDVVRLRTNFRDEDVYLYHHNASPEEAREFFLSYVRQANSLSEKPRFYNTATSNCVSTIVENARDVHLGAARPWEVLLSGYAAQTAYRNGRLDTSIPFEELQARSRITPAALKAANDPRFSELVRAGLPVPQARK